VNATRLLATSFLLLAAGAPAARAQVRPEDVPEMPRPAEITERVNKLLDELPEEHVEVAGVARLTYRKVPLDVHAVALKFGETLEGRQSPRGMPLDRYVRQFEGTIQEVLDARLADVGTLEALVDLKVKGKTIPVGTYHVGIACRGGRPAALVVLGDALPHRRPVPIKLKARRPELDPAPDAGLTLDLHQPADPKAGDERFDVVVSMRGAEAVSTDPVTRAEAAGQDDHDGDDHNPGK
jgi:hypothetical protein